MTVRQCIGQVGTQIGSYPFPSSISNYYVNLKLQTQSIKTHLPSIFLFIHPQKIPPFQIRWPRSLSPWSTA